MNNSELFKLKLNQAEHFSVLKTALKLSSFTDPDICLVSREGFKVYTHRWCKNTILKFTEIYFIRNKSFFKIMIPFWLCFDSTRSLLCLHSPLLSSLLCEAGDSCCCSKDGISVPATAASLHTLIQVLLEGSARLWEQKVREKFTNMLLVAKQLLRKQVLLHSRLYLNLLDFFWLFWPFWIFGPSAHVEANQYDIRS